MIKDLISLSSLGSNTEQPATTNASNDTEAVNAGMFGSILNALKQATTGKEQQGEFGQEENSNLPAEESEVNVVGQHVIVEEQVVQEEALPVTEGQIQPILNQDTNQETGIEQHEAEGIAMMREEDSTHLSGVLDAIESLFVKEPAETNTVSTTQPPTLLAQTTELKESEVAQPTVSPNQVPLTPAVENSTNTELTNKELPAQRISTIHQENEHQIIEREPKPLSSEKTELPLPEAPLEPASGMWNASGELKSGTQTDQPVAKASVSNQEANQKVISGEAKAKVEEQPMNSALKEETDLADNERPVINVKSKPEIAETSIARIPEARPDRSHNSERQSSLVQDVEAKSTEIALESNQELEVETGSTPGKSTPVQEIEEIGTRFLDKTVLSLRMQDVEPVRNQIQPKPAQTPLVAEHQKNIPVALSNKELLQVQQETLDANTEPAPLISGGMDMDSETMVAIQNVKVGEVAVKAEKPASKPRSEEPVHSERIALAGDQSRSELHVLNSKEYAFESTLSATDQLIFSDISTALTAEQEALLQEYMVDVTEAVETKASQDHSSLGHLRLSELPISNVTVRRNISVSFAEAIKHTKSTNQENNEVWQKHSFELEDGNSIELTTRNVDGVLQIKVAASSMELSRLLQQHLDEIKDHLEQELSQDLDLQFDQKDEGELAQFFDQSSGKKNQGERPNHTDRIPTQESQIEQNINSSLQNSIRKFGYNQMEWIG